MARPRKFNVNYDTSFHATRGRKPLSRELAHAEGLYTRGGRMKFSEYVWGILTSYPIIFNLNSQQPANLPPRAHTHVCTRVSMARARCSRRARVDRSTTTSTYIRARAREESWQELGFTRRGVKLAGCSESAR